jgi:hypothetical protein
VHDPQDAGKARPRRHFIEAKAFARLVEQDIDATILRRLAQGSVPQLRPNDDRRPEGLGVAHCQIRRRGHADLRQVGAVDRGRMQVDAEIGPLHDLGHEQMGETSGQGSALAARKRPVQIASIGQVAGMVEKAERIDDGHDHQRTPDRVQLRRPQ